MSIAYYGNDGEAKTALIEKVKAACLDKGFFQIINHNVSESLRQSIMQQTKAAFDLDADTKLKYNKSKTFHIPYHGVFSCSIDNNTWNRGFETMGTQILEEGTLPEVKEGFYIGRNLAEDDPAFVARRFNCGPNYYPPALGSKFKELCEAYHTAVLKLAGEVLRVLALTLDLGEDYFTDFIDDAVGTIRYVFLLLCKYTCREY
jgi:isopenicillin N synthase-like dioxygenase